jgi:Phage integrase family
LRAAPPTPATDLPRFPPTEGALFASVIRHPLGLGSKELAASAGIASRGRHLSPGGLRGLALVGRALSGKRTARSPVFYSGAAFMRARLEAVAGPIPKTIGNPRIAFTRSAATKLRMLTALRKEFPDSGYVFTTERNTPFTPDAIDRMIKTIGTRAKLPMPVHCHMLRHSCGYKLANDGIDTRVIQDWLGHVSITHTTRYTALSPVRFRDLWKN